MASPARSPGGLDRRALEAALRARLPSTPPGNTPLALPSGFPPLPRAALHVLDGEAAGLAAVLLGLAGGVGAWVAGPGGPWPVLAPHGLSPARLLLIRAEGEEAAWAAAAALRCPAVGGVVLAARAPLEGLQAAAAEGGGIGLLLGQGEAAGAGWRVEGAGGGGLADPSWQVSLARGRRGRAEGPWRLTWRAGEGRLVLEG